MERPWHYSNSFNGNKRKVTMSMKGLQMKWYRYVLSLLLFLWLIAGRVAEGNLSIQNERFNLILNSEGYAEKIIDKATGQVLESHAENPIFKATVISKETGVPAKAFDQEGTRTIDLNQIQLEGNKLYVSAGGELPRFTFLIGHSDNYLTFRMIKVEDIDGNERVISLDFELPFEVEVFPLDYMTQRSGKSGISWPAIWCRDSQNPLGGFALWSPRNNDDDDNTFFHIWVNEDLPHPKVAGQWTVERAKDWVDQWQEKFSYYRMMYILPEKPEDLKPLADAASKWGMTHVYLHKDVWFKDGYWENESDSSALNASIFPNGHKDLLEYSQYLKSRGMGLTVRTTSWGIGKNNQNYVGKEASGDFAKWVSGKLARSIDSKSTEIFFMPDDDVAYPPSYMLSHIRMNQLLIGNEIVTYSSLVDTDKPVWRFLDCQRGSFATMAKDHSAGTDLSGLKMCHGQVFCPDPDSELFEEQARDYADFMNSMLIDNCNFDALEVYNVNPYGRHKFLDAVYRKIDHPTWSFTSGGYPQWGWFEFELESSKKLLGWDRPTTIPKRQDLMVGLHQEFWPASGPYDYCYAIVPNAVADWRYLRVQANKGFHNLSLSELEQHGLSKHYIKNLELWKKTGPRLLDAQKNRIYSAYFNRETLFGKEGGYPSADELFRIEYVNGDKAVIPFRMMKRREGDRPWSYAQEHGLVKPAQYIRPGTSAIEMKNPYATQGPEFIIRVMTDFGRDVYKGQNIASVESKEQREFNDMLDTFLGASAVKIDKQQNAESLDAVNFRILPKADDIENTGKTQFSNEADGLRISCSNATSEPYALIGFKKDELPWYRVNTDITGARGLGMIVNGDGSGAILTVRISGNGTRDYPVAINFTGKRYIEIPTAEACWANGYLTWTTAYKRYRSNHITKVSIGFAAVPANTNASVLVEGLRFLPELKSDLRNPVIHVGQGKLSINGVIPTGHYLWYKGGENVGVYDLNWNLVKQLEVNLQNYQADSGYNPIRITHDKGTLSPWLETLFFVHDEPMMIEN